MNTRFLTRLLWRLKHWFFEPTSAERLGALRVLVFGFAVVYLVSRAKHLTHFTGWSARSFQPVGPVSILETPLPEVAVYAIFACALVSGVAALLGKGFRWSGPLFGASLLWVTSYRNSWGMVFHTENLFVLHVLVLSLSGAADAVALGPSLSDRELALRERVGAYSWPIKTLGLVTVSTYVLAGIAKLRIAGLEWAAGSELRTHIAYDAVRKLELGSWSSPLAGPLVSQEWVFAPLAWLTLAFELAAPLALVGRKWALVWSALAWGFHFGVLATMAIVFPYPLVGIAFAGFFAVERLIPHRYRDRFAPRLRNLTEGPT